MYKIPENIESFSFKSIQDIKNKRILIRCSLNTSVDKNGEIIDKTRLDSAIRGLEYFIKEAKQVIILGHLGRPEQYSENLSFYNIAKYLEDNLNLKVDFIKYQEGLRNSENKIVLIDNIRFFENSFEENLAEKLSKYGDVFVNDSFPDYRESPTTTGINKYLPSFIGPTFLEEILTLSNLKENKKPFVSILGGAKLSEKIDILKELTVISDKIIVGGAMAYTILKAQGYSIGRSLFEPDKLKVAKEILTQFEEKLILPIDHIVCSEFSEESAGSSTSNTEGIDISENKLAIDIGKETIEIFKNEIKGAKTILWNGPMGVFEWANSKNGTLSIGREISVNKEAFSIVGGGDTITAINKFGLSGFSHISMGGGAMMEFISKDKFATLDAILHK